MSRKMIIITICIVIALSIVGVIGIYGYNFNDHYETITVVDKAVKYSGNSNNTTSKYLIYGRKENGIVETYEITDNTFRWQFDSSNKYGGLQIDNTYKIKIIGLRVPYMSWYENIIGYEEVANEWEN